MYMKIDNTYKSLYKKGVLTLILKYITWSVYPFPHQAGCCWHVTHSFWAILLFFWTQKLQKIRKINDMMLLILSLNTTTSVKIYKWYDLTNTTTNSVVKISKLNSKFAAMIIWVKNYIIQARKIMGFLPKLGILMVLITLYFI